MLRHCIERASLAVGRNSVFVATCDQEIVDYVESIGHQSIMTSHKHSRATTRTAEACEKLGLKTGDQPEIVIMLQGDEPLVHPHVITQTIHSFDDPEIEIVNIMSEINSLEIFSDANNVKVVVNKDYDAMYFSRSPIPSNLKNKLIAPAYMQSGVIGFRRRALFHFNQMAETPLEKAESIDMNRAIESGLRVRMVPTRHFMLGVDTEEDMEAAKKIMSKDTLFLSYQ